MGLGKRTMSFAGTLCATATMFVVLAAEQGMPSSKTESENKMVFADKPDYMVLPREGDAAAVECAVYPPRLSENAKKAGMVLHLYGRGGSARKYNMKSDHYSMVRRLLWERGYWIVVPDLGGVHWMNDKACRTLDAIIESMIKEHGVDPDKVSILGTSMGGGSGLAYAVLRPGRVRSICAIFPMTDFAQWGKESPGYLNGMANAHGVKPEDSTSALDALSPLKHAASFAGIPVFLLHGDTDTIVPTHHSRNFAEALKKQGSPVIYREALGVGHSDVIAEPFQQEIADFLTGTAAKYDIKPINK